jgi:predicted dehydrogenase
MKSLRLGLIGTGKHGSRYAKHIVEDLPQAELAAVCRRDRQQGEKLAASYGCPFYADYHALIRDAGIDAVAVVVPPAFHGEIVAAACAAGKHILIEKPLAVSVAEACRIRDSIATSGVRCMVAHTLRFNTVVQTVKSYIAHIAPLHSIYLSQRFEPSPLVWLDHKAESGGGIVLHTGVHSFDLLRFLSGCEVEQVWCQTTQVFTKETEDNFLMLCRMSDPTLTGAVAGSRSTHSRSGLIEISGEKGQILGDHAHGFAYLLRGLERIPLSVEPLVPTVRETLRAFVEGLLHGRDFPITVEDGLRAVAVAEACYQATLSGRTEGVEQA